MAKITVQNTDISVVKYNEEDYISLTDMARSQLQEEHGDIFAKMNTYAFIVDDISHAIYENGELYFQSYTIANQIFALKMWIRDRYSGFLPSSRDRWWHVDKVYNYYLLWHGFLQ